MAIEFAPDGSLIVSTPPVPEVHEPVELSEKEDAFGIVMDKVTQYESDRPDILRDIKNVLNRTSADNQQKEKSLVEITLILDKYLTK